MLASIIVHMQRIAAFPASDRSGPHAAKIAELVNVEVFRPQAKLDVIKAREPNNAVLTSAVIEFYSLFAFQFNSKILNPEELREQLRQLGRVLV